MTTGQVSTAVTAFTKQDRRERSFRLGLSVVTAIIVVVAVSLFGIQSLHVDGRIECEINTINIVLQELHKGQVAVEKHLPPPSFVYSKPC